MPVVVGCSVVGARLVRVGSRGVHVRVTVGVPVVVVVGVSVMVGVRVAVGVGLDAAVGVLIADAVAVKKSSPNASRVCIFSMLNVAVGELTTFGKSPGCAS